MNKISRSYLVVIALLVLGLLAVVGYKLWPVLYPTVIETAKDNPDCDLHQGPCTLAFADGATVTFAITPRPVEMMEPIALHVRTQGIEPWSVAVDIQGVSMNMGYNRPELVEEAPGSFTGSTILPICVRERMDWTVRVLVRNAAGIRAAPYHLVTWNR